VSRSNGDFIFMKQDQMTQRKLCSQILVLSLLFGHALALLPRV
jgi:hypothetical protein